VWLPVKASAAHCGGTAAGFEAWKRQFAGEAQARGVSASAIAALMSTNYSTATIAADRGQTSPAATQLPDRRRGHCRRRERPYPCEGAVLFKHALRTRLRGDRLEAARLGLPFRRVDHWLKAKNPAEPAVRRQAEEDWDVLRAALGAQTPVASV
jgi:hypothetical protein